jgi:hypothetical protein
MVFTVVRVVLPFILVVMREVAVLFGIALKVAAVVERRDYTVLGRMEGVRKFGMVVLVMLDLAVCNKLLLVLQVTTALNGMLRMVRVEVVRVVQVHLEVLAGFMEVVPVLAQHPILGLGMVRGD